MTTHMPDDGVLVDMIPKFAPTAAQQKALLVDNPMRLYWSDVMSRRHAAYDDIPGTTVFDAQALAQGLSPQHVLHVADEGGEPRGVQSRRGGLSRRSSR